MDKPQDILDARLAKGEITLDEYQKLSATITKTAEPTYIAPLLAPNHRAAPFNDLPARPIGPIATILRGAILISCLLAAVVQMQVIALASKNDKASAIAAVDIIGAVSDDVLSQLQGLAGLVLAVVFFYWLYRGTQNLQRIGAPLSIWPIGAVGWWFVPIAFFWKPYAALSQLWRGSLYGQDWINGQTPRALRTWWILFWIGLILSIGLLVFVSYVRRDSFAIKNVANVGAVISSFLEIINVTAMLLLYKIVNQITELHDARLPATSEQAHENAGGFSWSTAALGVLIFAGLTAKHGIFDSTTTTSTAGGSANWRISTGADPINGTKGIYAHGHPSELTGTNIPPTLIIECSSGKPLIAFDYKQPMKDAAPDGTLDFVHVILKVDNDDPVQLTFVPSQDWTVLSQSKGGAVADGTAAILNGIFGDFLPEAKNVRLTWDAQVVLRAIGQSDRLVTRATARNNIAVTATYDLAGFKEAYRAMPTSCR